MPSPSQPDLEEAGDAAFDQLKYITAPVFRSSSGIGCSKSLDEMAAEADGIEILEEKRVAGFDAVVLKAGTTEALVDWLARNDYSYSDAVAAWAQPYVERGWPFTALKVAPGEGTETDLEAAALRISFQTDTPLFPYREPESSEATKDLGISERLLRIYFISDQSYEGKFDTGKSWSGKKVWSGDISGYRTSLAKNLQLPEAQRGPENWWLTEIEDQWPYALAPGDVVFSPSKDQRVKERHASRSPHDPLPYAAVVFAIGLLMRRRVRGLKQDQS